MMPNQTCWWEKDFDHQKLNGAFFINCKNNSFLFELFPKKKKKKSIMSKKLLCNLSHCHKIISTKKKNIKNKKLEIG